MKESPFSRLSQKWIKELNEDLAAWLKDSLVAVDFSGLGDLAASGPRLDPYRVLGLTRSASDEEVRKRYRELLRHLHPDTAGVEGTEALLQVVMAAYGMIKKDRNWQ